MPLLASNREKEKAQPDASQLRLPCAGDTLGLLRAESILAVRLHLLNYLDHLGIQLV